MGTEGFTLSKQDLPFPPGSGIVMPGMSYLMTLSLFIWSHRLCQIPVSSVTSGGGLMIFGVNLNSGRDV